MQGRYLRALAVGSSIVVGACSTGHRPPTVPDPAATAWDQGAGAAFAPLTSALPSLDAAVDRWSAGSETDTAMQGAAAAAVTSLVDTRARVDALAPFPGDPRVNDLYRRSVLLDLQAANVYGAATAMTAGSARDQVRLLGVRLRRLGDRVFDRGRALVQTRLGPLDPNLVVNLPEEVPNWVVEGLAAGPPLDPGSAAARPLPASAGELRAPSRPSGSRRAWERAVESAHVPPAAAVDAAVSGGSEPDGALAHTFVAAAEVLRTTPDPAGDREESARVRLGLLVDADAVYAARAAYEARAVDAGAAAATSSVRLLDVARRLDLVGAGLWAPELGPRSSGLSPALLSDDR